MSCRALSRSNRPSWAGQATEWLTIPSYTDVTALRAALAGARYVLHLADNPARNDIHSEGEAIGNCDALIEAIRDGSVEGIVVASSIYARQGGHGEASSYGAVKQAIEARFLSAADIRTIVLRLPPVYGLGGRGGLAALSKLVRKGLPLPLASATAPRAYLSRRNLALLIVAIVNAGDERWRKAAGGIFEPSDGVAINTRDLVRAMAAQMDISLRLLPVPIGILRIIAAATGKGDLVSGAINRLDVAPVEELEAAFGWRPAEQMPESLAFLRDAVSSS
jgi:UDP-glucose 4-epimerase